MFAKETYIRRREELKKKVKSGIILLMGNGEAPLNYPDNTYSFRQDSSFLYFAGLDTPDLYCVIDVDNNNEFLFGNELTIDDIVWMGNLPSLKERSESVGLNRVLPVSELSGTIAAALKSGKVVHYLKPYRHRNQIILGELLNKNTAEILAGCSLELTKAVIDLRLIKEDCELAEMESAGEIGYLMHLTAMKMCQQGIAEREIAGIIEGIAVSKGNRVSFTTILSQNGQTLHNHNHDGILQRGRLMLTDAGAENVNYYASDFTRTVAVGGQYSPKQIDIHNIVLQAINTAIDLIRPGIPYRDIHREAYRIIFDGLKDLGLTKGNTEDALANGAPALFMPHGLGHALGLDTHDMEDLGETLVGYDDEIQRSTLFGYKSLRFGKKLKERHVITVEPGIYFIPQLIEKWKQEKINTDFIHFDKLENYYNFGGIRLEDDVIVTKEGSMLVYPKRLPITIEEIVETIKG
ncbi:MAG: aminopeptidase P N-terminal domain-containing protein [Dysgonamonadaceae bacterium]|jgi:Xaa-Pro aminopeptidase|nr:aminopeptidase P N-terminal domain-containing protein [Dysgonamonadaceae bacterium]